MDDFWGKRFFQRSAIVISVTSSSNSQIRKSQLVDLKRRSWAMAISIDSTGPTLRTLDVLSSPLDNFGRVLFVERRNH